MSVRYSATLDAKEQTIQKISYEISKKYYRKPKLSYFKQAILGVLYIVEHKTLHQLAKDFDVSLGSAFNYVNTVQEILAGLLPSHMTDLEQALKGHQEAVIDGTLFHFANKYIPGFTEGKHKKSGVNVQVITTLGGQVLWVSSPLPGATHDTKACRIFDVAGAATISGTHAFADKGYVGANVDGLGQVHDSICHLSKIYSKTSVQTKKNSEVISSIPRVVETPFSRLKNYAILAKCRMHLGRGLGRVEQMIRSVVSLHLLEGKSW